MSGSGADAGYDYQADATAYVAAHALAGQPLPWFEGAGDIPVAWSLETGGPGDDIEVVTQNSGTIEIQAKHALKRGDDFKTAFTRLIAGLKKSLALRGVLLIDRHASLTLRDDLKHDIVRIGEGRTEGLKQITTELLAELNETASNLVSVFARLRVVVVDLDEGSDGVSVAQSLLARVVAPENAGVAYALLGKRYHRMIKRSSRDTVHSCARFLDGAVGLASVVISPAVSTTRFSTFLRRSNADFYAPALQVRFPIANAWNQLLPLQAPLLEASVETNALELAIKRYQEWGRLTRDQYTAHALPAEVFVHSHAHTVIVGGPGSGKTTLSRKLAHHFCDEGLAVWVRLPTIAALVASGATYERSLVQAAIDNSPFSESEGREIVASADVLIVDGLDECDPIRANMAESISRWASGHPKTNVCVLTRPVGHSPELLPGFVHAELLPLDKQSVRRMAGLMLSSKVNGPRCSPMLADFLGTIREPSSVASIASRNPLLLSFLVRLFIDGQPVQGRRAALFERIIEQIRKSAPTDRLILANVPDYASSWAAAEVLGWSCIDKPDRAVAELYRLVSDKMGGGVNELRRAEAAIRQWTDHGLLERLTAGSLDALVFVHPALGEYLAGRYLAQLEPDRFKVAITHYRRKAKWREPLLHCAGSGAGDQLVGKLIELDQPEDPESNEGMLAAAAIAEADAGTIQQQTIAAVASTLKERLRSNIPLVAHLDLLRTCNFGLAPRHTRFAESCGSRCP